MSHKPFLDLAERVSLVMHIDLPWDKPRSEPKCERCGGEPDYEAVPFFSDQCDEDLSQALCKACAGLGIPSGCINSASGIRIKNIILIMISGLNGGTKEQLSLKTLTRNIPEMKCISIFLKTMISKDSLTMKERK